MPLPPDPSFGCQYAPNGSVLTSVPTPPPLLPLPPVPVPPSALPSAPPGVSPDQVAFPYVKAILRTFYKYKNNIIQLPVAKKPAPLPTLGDASVSTPDLPGGVLGTPTLSGGVAESPSAPASKELEFIAEAAPPSFSPTPQGTSNSGGSTMEIPKYGDVAPSQASGSGATVPDTAASNRPAAKIIQVGAPTGEKVIEFEFIRMGAQCDVPNPAPQNSNEILKDVEIEVLAPIPTPDGNDFYWGVRGRFIYSLLIPYWASDGLVGGSLPVDNTTLQSNWYQNSQYVNDLA